MAVAVPAQYQPLVAAAAKGTGLPAAVVAAQANMESGFNARATSPTGAQGWLQFEPATWKAQGVSGSPYDPAAATQGYIKLMGSLLHQFGGNVRNALAAYNAGPGNLTAGYGYADKILSNAGHGAAGSSGGLPSGTGLYQGGGTTTVPVSQQVFDQAGFNAAKARYIAGQAVSRLEGSSNPYNTGPSTAGSNPLLASGLLTTSAPDPAAFTSTQTHNEQVATGQLQALAGQPLVNAHAGAAGDVNPIPGAVIGRTDMGVDANLKPGDPVLAPNDARVVAVNPGWYKGQPYIALQLTSGPNAGKVMYVAEQVAPAVRVGQTLSRGSVVGRYAASGTGIEIGWANPSNPSQTLAQGTTGYAEGQQTKAGTNFRSYLGQLGA